jgi:hypothetical protein
MIASMEESSDPAAATTDITSQPQHLLCDVPTRIVDPSDHEEATLQVLSSLVLLIVVLFPFI